MKILIINISLRPAPARKWPPVGLGYVASAIKRAGFSFDILDLDIHPQPMEVTEEFLKTHRYDVVIMGCIVTGYRHVKGLSAVIKNAFPDTKIIVGNTVASSIPEILLTNTPADIAVIGEGDETIVDLLSCLEKCGKLEDVKGIWYRENGEIKNTPPRPAIENIDEIPTPDWDLFDVEAYIDNISKMINDPAPPIPKEKIRYFPINTARGCPFRCTFCYHAFRDYKYRHRSSSSVIAEMKKYHEKYKINFFTFGDELTFYSIQQADEFADSLIKSGLNVFWEGDCRSGLFTKDEDVATAIKLKQSGCISLSYSLESSNPEILKWMNKKFGPETFARQVELLKRAGIPSLTSIVFGYPNETEETIKKTIDCCIENGIYPSAGYLLPQPGSEMYEYAKKHNFIPDEEKYLLKIGDRQDLHLNMTQMSDDELLDCVKRELARCARDVGIEIPAEKLLKTGFYRSPDEKKRRT
jgi:anaerobic magnesium-protoporphyrin IX monomethyl ester cyclase